MAIRQPWERRRRPRRSPFARRQIPLFGALVVLGLVVALLIGVFDRTDDRLRQLALVGGTDGTLSTIDADGTGLVPIAAGTAPAWSGDGRRLAFAAVRDGRAVVRELACDGEIHDVGPGTAPALSADGRRLARVRGGRVVVSDATGGGARTLTLPGRAVRVALAPNGTRLAVEVAGPTVRVVALPSGRVERTIEGARAPAWSRAGRLAWIGTDGVAAEDGPALAGLAATAGATAFAWAPGGRRIAAAVPRGGGRTRIVVVGRDPVVDVPQPAAVSDRSPTFSGDGRRVGFVRSVEDDLGQLMAADATRPAPARIDNAPPVRFADGALAWRPRPGC